MEEMIARDKNHPSVVMWSLANEPASTVSQANGYFRDLVSFTRTLDAQQRPLTIVMSDSERGNQTSCAQYIDVLCLNRYYAWYSDPGALDLIEYDLVNELTQLHTKYQKPIIVSEYGADTVSGLHTLPAVMFTEEYQVEFMARYQMTFDKLKKQYLVGELPWNFGDFATPQSDIRVGGLNRKGLFDRQRNPKLSAYKLKERYADMKLKNVASTTEFLIH